LKNLTRKGERELVRALVTNKRNEVRKSIYKNPKHSLSQKKTNKDTHQKSKTKGMTLQYTHSKK
jgi:hypothetical protein